MSTKTKKSTTKKVEKVKTTEFKSSSGRTFVKSSAGVEFWNPSEGETIEGEFLELMEFKGGKYSKLKDGKGNPIQVKPVILTDEDKQVALPDTASVTKFFETVEKGEFIHITYNGKKAKKGQEHKKNPESYHSYDFAKAK